MGFDNHLVKVEPPHLSHRHFLNLLYLSLKRFVNAHILCLTPISCFFFSQFSIFSVCCHIPISDDVYRISSKTATPFLQQRYHEDTPYGLLNCTWMSGHIHIFFHWLTTRRCLQTSYITISSFFWHIKSVSLRISFEGTKQRCPKGLIL
jgi:hypothetical protein